MARPIQICLYARVSFKDQEREGFSIPAQLTLLREYATAQGLTGGQEYVDVETAKRTGRGSFGRMVDDLRRGAGSRVVLVEKTDRLYRNLKDWVTLDELGLEVHLVKEGVVLSAESRSSEKFMHGIKVLMAVSTLHTILRKRIYMGEFEWKERIYPGVHEPIVSREIWDRVQDVLDGRHARRHRRAKHDLRSPAS